MKLLFNKNYKDIETSSIGLEAAALLLLLRRGSYVALVDQSDWLTLVTALCEGRYQSLA